MRTLPTGVDTLLKSRSMIGANKPSYAVSIEGFTAGVDWDSMGGTWHTPKAAIDAGGISIETKADGKLIVVGMVSGTVYEGEVADVTTLLGGDDTVTAWASTGITTNYYGRCQVFSADGDLWLSVMQAGDADENASLRLYKSASGNGGDWALYSTVYSHTSGGIMLSGVPLDTSGSIVVLPTGRYVLGTVEYNAIEGYKQPYPTVWISDDDGLNWTKKYTGVSGGPVDSSFVNGVATKIVRTEDGTLFFSWGKDYGTTSIRIATSTDNGLNWSYAYESIDGTNISGGSLYVDTDNNLYFMTSIYGSHQVLLARLTQPTIDGAYEYLTTQPPNDGYGLPIILTSLTNKIVLIAGEFVLGIDVTNSALPVKSISISRNKNMAASLELVVDNKDGDWSPDGTLHKEILWPNTVVTIEQGYGTELVTTFKGLIDRIEMTTFPQELKLSCRDYLKYALDQLVTKAVTGGNTHVLTYTAQTVEYIVTDLASLCGLTLLETIYTTGITVAEITFSWCSYADAFQQLADLVGADFGCDEDGKFYFKKDYIADTPTIAFQFVEGETIVQLGYVIDDADIFEKVVCYGQKADGTTVFAQTNYTSRVYYNVLANKYMKIDAGTSAQTVAEAQALSDRAEILMRSRVRICTFAAVAVPWLQVGDVIQVIETSSTISEAYRVTDLSTTMDDTYTMMITCYHHSYTA